MRVCVRAYMFVCACMRVLQAMSKQKAAANYSLTVPAPTAVAAPAPRVIAATAPTLAVTAVAVPEPVGPIEIDVVANTPTIYTTEKGAWSGESLSGLLIHL